MTRANIADGEQQGLRHVPISGLRGTWSEIPARYDYAQDASRCPNCGGLGIPWRGWFSCEECCCKALVEDGRAFMNDNPSYPDLRDL